MKNKNVSNYIKGKVMFYECFGNSMSLDREYGSEYRKCKIPKDVENKWLKQIKIDLVNIIENSMGLDLTNNIFVLLNISKLEDILPLLLQVLSRKNLDTFARILICESLKEKMRYLSYEHTIIQTKRVLDENKNKMLNEPINIDDSYLFDQFMKNYDFSEENIMQRIKSI